MYVYKAVDLAKKMEKNILNAHKKEDKNCLKPVIFYAVSKMKRYVNSGPFREFSHVGKSEFIKCFQF